MKIYDFIIIGGGIAGLNITLKLSNISNNIILCEKNNYFGGRIYTYNEKNIKYETGAARFNNTHKKLFNLINHLKLKKFIFPITNNRNYIQIKNKNKLKILDYDKKFNELFEKLLKKSKNFTNNQLRKMTFNQYSQKILNKNELYFFNNYFSYYSELYILNAEVAIKIFKQDFNINKKFYMLSCGLSKLVNEITKKIKSKKIKIYKNKKFISYSKINNIYEIKFADNTIKYTKNIIFSIPQSTLIKIKQFKNLKNLFNSIKCEPLLRIYAVYPKINNKVWFHNMEKVVTDNPLKFIIPYDQKSGLIMISYTDGKFAKYWLKINKNNQLEKEIEKNLKIVFPNIEIPKAKFLKFHYWTNGACYYKKNYDFNKIYNKILKPLKNENIYICGENFSKRQAWIEGALETSHDVYNKIIKKN